MPRARPVRVALAAAVVMLVSLVACGGGKKGKSSGDGQASPTSTSSTSSSTSTSGSVNGNGNGGTTPNPPDGGGSLAGAALTPVSVPPAGPALLTAVRTSTNAGFDRVVLEFDGTAPGYEVKYIDRPVQEDGSGKPVDVQGGAVLQIKAERASGADLSGGKFRQTYTGPTRIAVNGPAVIEVVRSGDFEGVLHWVVGTHGRLPFKVSALSGPTRLVVDIATPANASSTATSGAAPGA